MKHQKKQFSQAFTLVELIIVITILAILATIAFISFKGYAGNARDGNKLTTLSSIEKWFSLYQIKTWSYPNPDNIYGNGIYSWTLLSQVWYVWSGVVQSISMNKIPKDPIVNFEYTYSLSNDKKYYQLWAVLENNQTSFISQTYANNYTSKVVWNYRWLYKFTWVDSNQYITNLPSLIFIGNWEHLETENTTPQAFFVINNGKNLVKPYNDVNNESVTGTLLQLIWKPVELKAIRIWDWNVQSGSLKDNLWYSEDEIWREIFWDKYPIDKGNLQTPPVIAWKNISGTHCDNDDFVFTTSEWTTYRWAWCNSVLWDGFEWGKKDDGTDGEIGSCYSYNVDSIVIWNCPVGISWNAMYSSAKEKNWDEASSVSGTVNNIWWKLYNYNQATSGACPDGWHLPNDAEWAALETKLKGNDCRSTNCPWLWWKRDSSASTSNNIVEALKIPLAGRRNADEIGFYSRGYQAYFWYDNNSIRYFHAGTDTVISYTTYASYGLSVRCVKNQ